MFKEGNEMHQLSLFLFYLSLYLFIDHFCKISTIYKWLMFFSQQIQYNAYKKWHNVNSDVLLLLNSSSWVSIPLTRKSQHSYSQHKLFNIHLSFHFTGNILSFHQYSHCTGYILTGIYPVSIMKPEVVFWILYWTNAHNKAILRYCIDC